MSINQQADHTPQTARTIGMAAAAVVALILAVGVTWYYTRQEAYVAKVNGEPIPITEFQPIVERQKSQYVQRMNMNFSTPQGAYILNNIQRQTINHLVEQHILLQESRRLGVSVEQGEVDKKLQEILQRNFGGNQSQMDKAMRDSGLTMADVKQLTLKNLMIEKAIKQISQAKPMTDAEIMAYYKSHPERFQRPDEVKASHILVKTEAEARKILAQLRAGGDFAALAKKHSLDPGSKTNGGDLGFFGKGRMVPAFEQTAFKLRTGEISAPVKTNFGYHIIKVTDRHGAEKVPFATAKQQLVQQLANEGQQKKFTEWFEGAKRNAKIVIQPQYESTAAPPPPANINPGGGPPGQGAPPQGAPPHPSQAEPAHP